MCNVIQKNIKRLLKDQNLSIAELERRAGLRHSVINIVHGRSKNPSVKIAHAIAKELGCTMEELLSEELLSNNLTATSNQANLDLSNNTPNNININRSANSPYPHSNEEQYVNERAQSKANLYTDNINDTFNSSKTIQKHQTSLLEKDFTPIKRNTPWNANLASNTLNAIQKFISENNLSPTIMEIMNCWLEAYNYCYGTKNQIVDERFIEWFMERNFLSPKY